MITGVVTDHREAVIRLRVHGPAGQDQEIEAIIDTGFDGWLSLPSSIVAQLQLDLAPAGSCVFGGRPRERFDIYEATLDWDGEVRRIPVDEAETVPLVGMSLLEGHELCSQARSG
jgi:clan AA aspartic protease